MSHHLSFFLHAPPKFDMALVLIQKLIRAQFQDTAVQFVIFSLVYMLRMKMRTGTNKMTHMKLEKNKFTANIST